MKVRATRLFGGGTGLGLLTKSIELDFLSGSLDPRITFTRASSATYFDSAGVLQTAANDVARFDYNPSTLAARGLLIEEQRTNSLRNNTMVGAVAGTPGTLPTNWFTTAPTGLTRTISLSTVNGINCIDISFTGTATSSAAINIVSEPLVAASNGQSWSGSAWVQLLQDDAALTQIHYETWLYDSTPNFLSTGTTNNFYATRTTFSRRVVNQTFSNASLANIRPILRTNTINNGTVITNLTFRVGLPQLEQGAFETSVIPTATTALTRSADFASMQGANFSNWYNQTEGTVSVEYVGVNNVSGATRRVIEIGVAGSTNDRYVIGYSATNQTRTLVVAGGATQADIYVNATQTNVVKAALAYAVNNINAASNGTIGTLDTSALVPAVSTLWLGTAEGSAANTILNGYIRRFSYYPSRLSDATLSALTS